MGPRGTLRAIQAAQRRQQRELQQRIRESERRAREQAKLSALEQARLEVDNHEHQLAVLLSVHKVQPDAWDWVALAASLPPPFPRKSSHHELKTRQTILALQPEKQRGSETAIEEAQRHDEEIFQEAMQAYAEEMVQWDKTRRLARRILAREPSAFAEALRDLNPLTDLSELGSSFDFTVHSPRLIECTMTLSITNVIPKESKALTSSGKVSVRAMPKGRWHQICRDYLCGSVLRVAREVFALLPVDTVLVSASVDSIDPSGGPSAHPCVLSVVMPGSTFTQLPVDDLSPSDAISRFRQTRANFKSSRGWETFVPITPMTPADIVESSIEDMSLDGLFAHVHELRQQLQAERARMNLPKGPTIPLGGPP